VALTATDVEVASRQLEAVETDPGCSTRFVVGITGPADSPVRDELHRRVLHALPALMTALTLPENPIMAIIGAWYEMAFLHGYKAAQAEQARLVVGDAGNGDRRPEASDG